MAVRSWVGQFGIVQGQALEAGPWQGKFGLIPPGEEPVDLYVLVHPALPGSEEFCGQLVAVVGHLFEQQDLSLTGALTKAIGAAHENLRDWNRRSLREHQVGAGVSCLVVRGTVAYLAQVGPSLAYLRRNGVLTRLTPEDPRAVAVLGLGEELRPQLRRYEMAPGDLLLVVSPSLDEVAEQGQIEALLSRGADEVLSELYRLARDQPDFSVFLLSCFEEAVETVDEIAAEEPAEALEPPAEIEPAPPPAEVSSLRRAPDSYEQDEETESTFDLLGSLEMAPVAVATSEMGRETVRLRGSQPALRNRAPSAVSKVTQRFPRWALLAALFLGVVVFLAWWVIPGSIEGNRAEKFDSLLADAKTEYSTALTLADLSDRREALERASGLLAEAENIRSNGEVTVLKGEVAAALSEMNGVQELTGLRVVADLKTQLTGDLSLQRLVAGGGYAYLLDTKKGRVVSVSLVAPEGKTEEALQEGDAAGMAQVGQPLRIAWLPDVDGGSLLVFDSERHVFSLRPGVEAVPLALDGSDGWGSLDAVFAGADGLFVLDREGSRVWRYPAGEGGFATEPEIALEGTEVAAATGLAANGDLYLLDGKGGIRRFSAGQEMAFDMDGIDRPLTSPASLLPLSDGNLFVVDRGNKRIVLFTPDGRFLRQYVSKDLTDPQAVAVDEVAAHLYVLSGDTLYAADLPPAPDTPAGEGAEAAP
jgi:hypothetical protein